MDKQLKIAILVQWSKGILRVVPFFADAIWAPAQSGGRRSSTKMGQSPFNVKTVPVSTKISTAPSLQDRARFPRHATGSAVLGRAFRFGKAVIVRGSF
jgi:hypothetical protein